LEEEKNSGKG